MNYLKHRLFIIASFFVRFQREREICFIVVGLAANKTAFFDWYESVGEFNQMRLRTAQKNTHHKQHKKVKWNRHEQCSAHNSLETMLKLKKKERAYTFLLYIHT